MNQNDVKARQAVEGEFAGRDASRPHGASTRIHALDAVRGLASFYIVIHHALLTWDGHRDLATLQPIARAAYWFFTVGIGIDALFLVSGFGLYYVVLRRASDPKGKPSFSARDFFRRRVERILPPYYVALLFFALLSLVPAFAPLWHTVRTPFETWAIDVPLHALFLHNFSVGALHSINSSYWTIALEWQWYLAFPLLLLLAQRWGLRWVVLLAVALALAWHGLLDLLPAPAQAGDLSYADVILRQALPARLVEFVAGMAVAALVHQPRPRQYRVALACLVAAPLLVFADLPLPVHPALSQVLLRTLALFGLLLTLHRVLERHPRLVRLFALPIWMGGISYSIYLLHHPLLTLTGHLARSLSLSPLGMALAFVFLCLPCLYALSYWFHVAVERREWVRLSPARPPAAKPAVVSSPAAPQPAPVSGIVAEA